MARSTWPRWRRNASVTDVSHLISAAGLRVRQLPRHELEENDPVGVDVGLEAVRVVVLHADDLRSLRGEQTEPSGDCGCFGESAGSIR